jgi:uncharacterized protein (TIRG00374 family)
MRKKFLSFFLPLIGLAIFVVIVRRTGISEIIDTFRSIDAPKLLIFPPLILFILYLRGLRWQFLMKMVGIDYALMKSTSVWAIGFAAAAVTPAKVGDAIRVLYLSRDTGRNFGECLLTVFMDRLLDMILVVGFGVLTVLLFSYFYIALPSIWIILLTVLGISVLLYAVLHRGTMRRLLEPFFRVFIPERHKKALTISFNTFYDSLSVYFRNWKKTSFAFILALLQWTSVLFLTYAVAWVLEIDVSLFFMFLMMPVMTLAELVPISVSGVGTRDATVVYFFSVIGLSSAKAVAFSLTYLVTGTYLLALLGFLAWLKNPLKTQQ